ncbi:MAG: hypothetical protein IJB70_10070, partial [Clostridia bacterium]|nr:hypothetical protein [Clostridia bacterium]
VDLPLGKDGGVRNAEVSTLSAIPLSQFRYAHCQLPLGRGAFRPCVKQSDKPQFEISGRIFYENRNRKIV